jgi:hypothetical protein
LDDFSGDFNSLSNFKYAETLLVDQSSVNAAKFAKRMDLPPEYVLHLLPLMAVCGLPPLQQAPSSPVGSRSERTPSIDTISSNGMPAIPLAAVPYIDHDLGRAILAHLEQWRTFALWEPFAARERQVPGASLEGMFHVVPVDRVPLKREEVSHCRLSDCPFRR